MATESKKENENSLETKLKVTEDCNLNDRKFKIVVMKTLNNKKTQKGRRNTLSKRLKL